jgi:sugar-specific transcriptional regulator TrmB
LKQKKSEVDNLASQKDELLTSWHTISTPESDYTVAKFSIISGKKKIHVKMLNMIEEARTNVYVLTTGLGVIQ